jgi:hypothetical protein
LSLVWSREIRTLILSGDGGAAGQP